MTKDIAFAAPVVEGIRLQKLPGRCANPSKTGVDYFLLGGCRVDCGHQAIFEP